MIVEYDEISDAFFMKLICPVVGEGVHGFSWADTSQVDLTIRPPVKESTDFFAFVSVLL